MNRSILASAILLTFAQASVANESLINSSADYDTDTTIYVTDVAEVTNRKAGIGVTTGDHTVSMHNGSKLTVTVNDLSASGADRLYGVAAQAGSSLTIDGKLDVSLKADNVEIRAIRAVGGDLHFTNDTTIKVLDGNKLAEAVDVWDDSEVEFKGKLDILMEGEHGQLIGIRFAEGNLSFTDDTSVKITGGETNVISGLTASGGNGGLITFEGNKTDIFVESKGGRALGVENYNSQGSTVNFNATQTTITAKNDKNSDKFTQGVLAYQSTTNFNGNATITVEGGMQDTYGIDVQCNSRDPHNTIVNFKGASTVIDVSGTEKVMAVRPSGPKGHINFNRESVTIKATSANGEASGVNAIFGGTADFKGNVSITSQGKTAYGIKNSTFDGRGDGESDEPSEFGIVKVAGDANITVTGESAYGLSTFVNLEEALDLNRPEHGTFINGLTSITATATSSTGEAVGVMASNDSGAVKPSAKTELNNLYVKAVGQNGAGSYGIKGQNDAHIAINGSAIVSATGENAVGLSLSSSDLTIAGTTDIQGDFLGIELVDESANVVVKDNASLSTNSIDSEGTTTLNAGSTLSVTGSADGESFLGNIIANSASVKLGAGKFEVSKIEGEDNDLIFSDLNNLSAPVVIGEKSAGLNVVASSQSNNQYTNAQDTAKALVDAIDVSTDNAKDKNTFFVEAGDVNNSLTGTVVVEEDGTWTISNVQETKNDKLDAFSSVTALSALTLRHEMNSLSKRMGELRDAPVGVGAWVRGYGSEMEYGSQHVTEKNNSIQVGSDYTVGDWKVGAAFTYTDGESSYDHGSADHKGYGLAVYGTWFVPCGAYVDLMAKYNRLDNDFALNGMNGSYDANAYGVSAETGYRFNFMDGGVYVEPQVGIAYSRMTGETFTASNGVTIEQDDYDSLIGRVGVRTGFKFPKDKGTIYARISGVYDFQGEVNGTATKGVARNTIEEDLGGAWLEMGVGANFNWTKNTYTYIDFERTNGGEVKENYRWNVGVRHTF